MVCGSLGVLRRMGGAIFEVVVLCVNFVACRSTGWALFHVTMSFV